MHAEHSTQRLATPSILINQQVIGTDWSRLREMFDASPSINRDAAGVQSPLVINEAIEGFEQALIEVGDTPLDFMVLEAALRWKFDDHHVRLHLPWKKYTVHFVEGRWAMSTTVGSRSKKEPAEQRESRSTVSPAQTDNGWGIVDSLGGGQMASGQEPTVEVAPQPPQFVWQLLAGSRVGIDLVDPERALSTTD